MSSSLTTHAAARDRFVLALDLDDAAEALALTDRLKDHVGLFKVGHQLFTACGPDIVRRIVDRGCRVFLDLKYHDIPNTVARAAGEAVKLGVAMFNVHALGGLAMMQAAGAAAVEEASRRGTVPPIVLAVTVLTSMEERNMRQELKIARSLPRMVVHFARMAQRAGLHGVVASPQEIRLLRRGIRGDLVILTPGVRPLGADRNDQKRVMTPAEAVRAGADFIVVGRPVLRAADPAAAARMVLDEISLGRQPPRPQGRTR